VVGTSTGAGGSCPRIASAVARVADPERYQFSDVVKAPGRA
jgi:hypothetical protein